MLNYGIIGCIYWRKIFVSSDVEYETVEIFKSREMFRSQNTNPKTTVLNTKVVLFDYESSKLLDR